MPDSQYLQMLRRRRRWAVGSLLFCAAMLNYLDRQALSLVSPLLRRDLGLTGTSYSHIVTAFLLGYAFTQLIVGRIVDRVGPRVALFVAMLWWSAAGMFVATAHNVAEFGLIMLLMGVGEAACWPTSIKAIQECFEPKDRAVAVGYFNAGSPMGAIIAPLVVTRLALLHTWRVAFSVCGVIGLFWLIPWLFVYPSAGAGVSATRLEPEATNSIPLIALIRDRRVWGLVLARLFGDSIWFFYVFWLPDYLNRVRGFSLSLIGLTAWIPFLAGGVGNLLGGFASGALIRRGVPAANARLSVILASLAIMTLGAGVWLCSSPIVTIALISCVVFACCSWAANILTLPSDLFPASVVATTVGFSGAAAGFGGMLTTLLAGILIDHYSYEPVFWVLGMLPVCSGLSVLLTCRKGRNGSSPSRANWNESLQTVQE
jgi:ACS family hexuronate transporter-like MFS transporter